MVFHNAFDLLSCAISGGIIYEDYVIVHVVLHDDRPDIVDMTVILDIVVAWNYYAERKLFVLTHMVLLFIIISLLLGKGCFCINIFVF